ncbi:hypothetical protein ACFL4G_10120 [Thermodesulfobacteriota bacterium]
MKKTLLLIGCLLAFIALTGMQCGISTARTTRGDEDLVFTAGEDDEYMIDDTDLIPFSGYDASVALDQTFGPSGESLNENMITTIHQDFSLLWEYIFDISEVAVTVSLSVGGPHATPGDPELPEELLSIDFDANGEGENSGGLISGVQGMDLMPGAVLNHSLWAEVLRGAIDDSDGTWPIEVTFDLEEFGYDIDLIHDDYTINWVFAGNSVIDWVHMEIKTSTKGQDEE